MKLSELFRNIEVLNIIGDGEIDITGVNIDSRRIRDGHLFVAIPGTQTDGHKFIPKAIEQGAVAVMCEYIPNVRTPGVTYIVVESTEDCVGEVATQFYGDPSRKLQLVGVTGTNGKTTIATLLYNMFRKFGHKCGLLSTVCNYIEDSAIPADHTTPDPIELNRLLAQMVEAGCEYAFMECSSHAIAQKRIGGLKFAGGLFTNLTRDHLDYHGTFENYRDAKKAFFDSLGKEAFAITNADDKNGMFMVQNTKAQVKTYSIRTMADFKARIIECHFEGMYLDIDGREVGVQFIGKFNVSNLLAVYGAAVMLGKNPEDILVVMSTLKSVSGRLEPIRSPEGYTAIVDYAHTPDALENVLSAIHEVLNGKGHLITVCGAGGNRDKGKRPLMAQEAVKQSDKVIITSDNPRFEEPQDIIDDMLAGLDQKQMKKVLCIVDRKEAIRTACMLAEKGDVILIAGKGHEDYQEIKGIKHHFDDKEVVREIFSSTDN
jgi:UDP-N-acetylmuramoyl-L-alanyl-D-glutamate--2,6-diaminopimelate ligase